MEQLFIPKYFDPRSILLVNPIGKLKRLYCPFQVKTKEGAFRVGIVLWVEEVSSNQQDELYFIIYRIPYQYKHFILVAAFEIFKYRLHPTPFT